MELLVAGDRAGADDGSGLQPCCARDTASTMAFGVHFAARSTVRLGLGCALLCAFVSGCGGTTALEAPDARESSENEVEADAVGTELKADAEPFEDDSASQERPLGSLPPEAAAPEARKTAER